MPIFSIINLIQMQMTKGVLYILFWIEGCIFVNYGYVPVCNDPFFYSSKEHVAPWPLVIDTETPKLKATSNRWKFYLK